MPERIVQDEQVVRVAHIARDLASLPGVATPDWCRRATSVFITHHPASRVWVQVIAASEGAGEGARLRRIEASGYAEGAGCPRDPKPERLAIAFTRAALDGLGQIGSPGVVSVAGLLAQNPRPRGFTILAQHPRLLVGVAEVGRASEEVAGPRLLMVAWEAPGEASLPGVPSGDQLVLESVLPQLRDRLRRALGCSPGRTPWLSVCEQRVLDLLADGLSVPEIASALGRSPHTVHDHVKRLHAKLGTKNRGTLLVRALGHPPESALPSVVVHKPHGPAACREGAIVDDRDW